MNKTLLFKNLSISISIATGILAFLPDSLIECLPISSHLAKLLSDSIPKLEKYYSDISGMFGKLAILLIVAAISFWISYKKASKKVVIKKNERTIVVEYGDVLAQENALMLVPFDECFTTTVGTGPGDIKETSVCGQYLKAHHDIDISNILQSSGKTPIDSPSKYDSQRRYELGTTINHDGYLLCAFAPLEGDGRAHFESRAEYLNTLSKIWFQLYEHYNGSRICIPILGSGQAEIGESTPTEQELLDMIIYSYILSEYKIKKSLVIVCREREYRNTVEEKDFQLTRIGESL